MILYIVAYVIFFSCHVQKLPASLHVETCTTKEIVADCPVPPPIPQPTPKRLSKLKLIEDDIKTAVECFPHEQSYQVMHV